MFGDLGHRPHHVGTFFYTTINSALLTAGAVLATLLALILAWCALWLSKA
jgi:hypothetical protein